MNKKIICSLLCLNGICWANVAPYASPLLRGQLSVKAADGSWKGSRSLASGQWAQSKSGDTTLSVPGAIVRAESGTRVRYTVQDGALHLDAEGGRMFVAMESGKSAVPCTVTMGDKQVHVSRGEFVVDATSGLLSVVSGDAATTSAASSAPVFSPVKVWNRGTKPTSVKSKSLDERSRHLSVIDSSDALIASSLDALSQENVALAPLSVIDGGLLGAISLELTAADLALDEPPSDDNRPANPPGGQPGGGQPGGGTGGGGGGDLGPLGGALLGLGLLGAIGFAIGQDNNPPPPAQPGGNSGVNTDITPVTTTVKVIIRFPFDLAEGSSSPS